MSRETTNDKLLNIINGKTEDEEEEAYFRIQTQKAKTKLRKSVLYGCGARARIPKVKAKTNYKMSPFSLPTAAELPEMRISSAVPPGAHQDMGRMVQNNTSKSRNDPYRVFMSSSSMDPTIIHINQPPWYYGDNNKTKPADGNMITAAARYGFRGSRNIQQYHTNSFENPANTRTPYTPKFLTGDEIINEWVPPILATTFQTINNLESPKFWPENTEFVNGYKKKRPPTSAIYKRQTTVGEPLDSRPQTSASLSGLLSKTFSERNLLMDSAKLERTSTLKSLPMVSQHNFSATWSDKVSTLANSVLRTTLDRPVAPYEAHSLVDDTDVLRYSGSTAIVIRSQSNDECKFRLRLESNHSTLPYDLRWKQIEFQYRGILSRLKKEQTMQSAIEEIGSHLRFEAIHHGSPTTLRRPEFVATLQKLHLCSAFSPKQFALLYSAFDPKGKNAFRFIEYVLLLGVYNFPNYDIIEKLKYLWDIYVTYGADLTPMNVALEIFSCCASTDAERISIEKAFKAEFRKVCYRGSILGVDKSSVDMDRLISDLGLLRQEPVHLESGGTLLEESSSIYKTDLTVPSQYNISDHFLDKKVFVDILLQCPTLLKLFSEQYQYRLLHLYGADYFKPKEEISSNEQI